MRLLQSLATKLPPVYEKHTDVVRDDSIRIVRLIATWLEAMGGYPKCYSQSTRESVMGIGHVIVIYLYSNYVATESIFKKKRFRAPALEKSDPEPPP